MLVHNTIHFEIKLPTACLKRWLILEKKGPNLEKIIGTLSKAANKVISSSGQGQNCRQQQSTDKVGLTGTDSNWQLTWRVDVYKFHFNSRDRTSTQEIEAAT
jgi:hypothetical protein